MANDSAMGSVVTAIRRPPRGRARTVPPTGWESDVRDRVVVGDDLALREVYDQYASFVYGIAVRVIGDRRAAEDVSQDVFVHFCERPAGFDPTPRELAHLAGHRHAPSIGRLRASGGSTPSPLRAQAARAVSAPDVEEMATALLTAERVRAALEVLPDEQRRAVHLAYFGGHTYRQVAEVLGIPEGTAKSRLRLALRRIAATLEAEGGEW